ncbi:MAG: methionine adenosyltransferase [Candidatus Bathyarchaeota archaeon]|nr:methionine adenosyltransferase [Candidatus Bathyarchaeota archaeon]
MFIGTLSPKSMEERHVEIVERKGRGHPDYVIDGASEAVSRELCKHYRKEFGVVLHHNIDKGLLVGGRAHPVFGGGEVIDPMYLVVAGRAMTSFPKNGVDTPVPVGSISLKAIRAFLQETFRFLDVDRHVIIDYRIKQSSMDLVSNFQAGAGMPLSNDTSFGVSYAPLSQTERLVLEAESYLNSRKVKKELPEVGEDIKVMGLRKDSHILLTIAAPQISSLTPDLDHYISVKEEVTGRIKDVATGITKRDVEVCVNTADDLDRSIVYLTVTGTSAEQGDDGNTGRGNRVHGLITPCRPMSLEATAGKNPINHVGKIYNVLARQMAEKVYSEVEGISEVYIKVLSQIGKPIDQPLMTDVQLILSKGVTLHKVRGDVESIVDEGLADVCKISEAIIDGKILLF